MTPARLAELVKLRQALHRIPEISGVEEQTAALVENQLRFCKPDQLLTGLGGHGVAAVFDGVSKGRTVLIRCELDGLPIPEISNQPYRSIHEGQGHLCGHDGHMTMVIALAEWLSVNRPAQGRVVLLFQPAEETGKGAMQVIADPQFSSIVPDYAFSLHNLPGLPIGQVALCSGAANCASRGMRIRLFGKTSHAAAPQDGVSPAGAISRLLPALTALSEGDDLGPEFALVTLTHARLGEASFGIAPGQGELWATLRTVTDARMVQLLVDARALVEQVATSEGLTCKIEYDDIFDACTNHSEAVSILQAAGRSSGHPMQMCDTPQRWSEDFGQFGKLAKTAMFWLGSGADQPQLHNPDYDFPDQALPVGVSVFTAVIDALLNS